MVEELIGLNLGGNLFEFSVTRVFKNDTKYMLIDVGCRTWNKVCLKYTVSFLSKKETEKDFYEARTHNHARKRH